MIVAVGLGSRTEATLDLVPLDGRFVRVYVRAEKRSWLSGRSKVYALDGDLRQSGFTSDMVFGVAEILEYITAVMTLLPGDVIMTGTPAGVGPIEHGDLVEVEVDGIGVVANTAAGSTVVRRNSLSLRSPSQPPVPTRASATVPSQKFGKLKPRWARLVPNLSSKLCRWVAL